MWEYSWMDWLIEWKGIKKKKWNVSMMFLFLLSGEFNNGGYKNNERKRKKKLILLL